MENRTFFQIKYVKTLMFKEYFRFENAIHFDGKVFVITPSKGLKFWVIRDNHIDKHMR